MAFAPHSLSASELSSLLAAERRGDPFLAYRDGNGDVRIDPLSERTRVTLGRLDSNDIALGWDDEVSRTHAELALVGADWVITDDGLSRNGTFVNGERLNSRRRLQDGDVVRVGRTAVAFRSPVPTVQTTAIGDAGAFVRLTDAERRVLVALCRPMLTGDAAVPATNQEIAAELTLSLPGVKTHLRSLSAKVGIAEGRQYRKRTELARRALEAGLVGSRDV